LLIAGDPASYADNQEQFVPGEKRLWPVDHQQQKHLKENIPVSERDAAQ
jgi:hypothetical protein